MYNDNIHFLKINVMLTRTRSIDLLEWGFQI